MVGPGRPARRWQWSPPQAAPRAYPAGLATLRAPVPVPAAPGSAVRAAPGFTLASTGGKAVSLASYRGRVVVLYFSEGVGCDACFYQMREFENHAAELAQAGMTVVPIMMNPAAQVRQEMTAFGIRAVPDRRDRRGLARLRRARHGHARRAVRPRVRPRRCPGHERWHGEYPSMYLSTAGLIAQVKAHH